MPPTRRLLTPLAAVLVGLMVTSHAAAVTGLSVDYPGAEGDMPAHLYLPHSTGRRPAVLVLHTSAGPGPNVEAYGRRLAERGFVAMTPDLFALHDFGPEGRVDHPLVLADLDGALKWLRRQPRVDPKRLGVVGFSYGGRLAVIAAATYPDLRAAVVYYAVASYQELARERPVGGRALHTRALSELAPTARAPVLIHHGLEDTTVPPSQARLLYDALQAAGRPAALYLYPGAAHLFNFAIAAEGQSSHHPEADRLAWQRTLDFLQRHLSAAP
ncbi:MAG TPA: dienelactone hydrolase family protein [Methylomirabilota bacterium]|nr:dienelactone hydrolase family protein [Methylomirabilota bacterium]